MSGNGPEEGKAAARGGGARWTRLAVLAAGLRAGHRVLCLDRRLGIFGVLGFRLPGQLLQSAGARFSRRSPQREREAPPGLAASGGDRDQAWLDAAASGVADMSYYKGKLYLYFGVTPALLLSAL